MASTPAAANLRWKKLPMRVNSSSVSLKWDQGLHLWSGRRNTGLHQQVSNHWWVCTGASRTLPNPSPSSSRPLSPFLSPSLFLKEADATENKNYGFQEAFLLLLFIDFLNLILSPFFIRQKTYALFQWQACHPFIGTHCTSYSVLGTVQIHTHK